MDQQMMSGVMPGDKLGVEEEFVASDNTYVDDDGSIRAAIQGRVMANEGKISVINERHNVKRIKRGMFALGRVSDDVKSVMFVKIDNVNVNGVEYIALKDGKIVNAPPRRPMRGDFGSRDRREEGAGRARESKPCSVGDVIVAKIVFEEPEIFTLAMDDRETGVVYAECEMCSAHLEVDRSAQGTLSCPECKHREQRKISALYAKPMEIIKLFA